MTRSHFVLASGLCSFTGMTLAGMVSASAEVVYVDEGAYTGLTWRLPCRRPIT